MRFAVRFCLWKLHDDYVTATREKMVLFFGVIALLVEMGSIGFRVISLIYFD